MSIETLTTDEFMELTKADHETAISLYEREVLRLKSEAGKLSAGSLANDLFDRMCSYLTIRKVHKGRLEEMEEEATATHGTSLPIAA